MSQEEINALLVDLGRGGKTVVRLKGGDPFVFGRGGEEALALIEAGLPFEVVPGVTSGIAAPAYAGIPVTHRSVSTSVAFVTGHEDPTKGRSDVDWASVAKAADTLVLYMGVGRLREISAGLVSAGRSRTPPSRSSGGAPSPSSAPSQERSKTSPTRSRRLTSSPQP